MTITASFLRDLTKSRYDATANALSEVFAYINKVREKMNKPEFRAEYDDKYDETFEDLMNELQMIALDGKSEIVLKTTYRYPYFHSESKQFVGRDCDMMMAVMYFENDLISAGFKLEYDVETDVEVKASSKSVHVSQHPIITISW